MICPRCGENKDTGEFSRQSTSKTGFTTHCKACRREQFRGILDRHYGGSTRHYHLRQKYGLGADDVDRMVAEQGGLCAICKREPATQVDHDHETGEVRGILCLDCNAGLGAFHDDVQRLYEAVDYLHPIPWQEWAS